jgi:tRNA A-37 threonylcarbamoyl transferase component Bud32
MHFAVNEAESKIRRRVRPIMKPPDFMLSPKKVYWRLPEGRLIVDGRNWLDDLAGHAGSYSISKKMRLGNKNSRTTMYLIKHDSDECKIAVKELAKSKTLLWTTVAPWSAPVKRFRMDPLFRLGSEYKAIRYIRSLGLRTPMIEAVVLDRRLLVTRFVEGLTLADVMRDCCVDGNDGLSLISEAGSEIAKIHSTGATLGNIKPKNIIVSEKVLYFTNVEQFIFQAGDPAWDIAQFISWGLKGTRNRKMASTITKEFVEGYMSVGDPNNISRLANSKQYIESFYPVRVPSIVHTIKKEIKAIAG